MAIQEQVREAFINNATKRYCKDRKIILLVFSSKQMEDTLNQIHSLYLEKLEEILPKEESQPVLENLRDVANRNIIWENGRRAGKNQCLAEIKTKMKEVQNGKILCIT